MLTTLPLSCACGTVRGTLTFGGPSDANRITCYCRDCQAFAHTLPHPERVLDPWGGTDVTQVSPARVVIDTGREHLACRRLSPKGLGRWVTTCCETPVGNMMIGGPPFIGLVHTFVDHVADGRSRDAVFGSSVPSQAKWARASAEKRRELRASPVGPIVKAVRQLASAWWRKEGARSPFVDASGALIVEPEVLDPAVVASAREAMERQAGS